MTAEIISLKEKRVQRDGIQHEFDFMSEKVTKSCAITLKVPLNLGMPKPEPAKEPEKPKVTLRQRWNRFLYEMRPVKDLYIRIRNWYERPIGDRLCAEIVLLGARLNRDDFSVFVNYSGHVDGMNVDVILGGYKSMTNKETGKSEQVNPRIDLFHSYLPGHGKYSKVRPKHLRAVKKLLIAYSVMSELQR